MNNATLDALHTLAISIQAAMHDNRRDDVIHLAAQVARLIREQTETPTLVERNTGGCPTCGDMAHAWTSPALDGYIDACLRHRNQIMRDAIAGQI